MPPQSSPHIPEDSSATGRRGGLPGESCLDDPGQHQGVHEAAEGGGGDVGWWRRRRRGFGRSRRRIPAGFC